MHPHPIIPVLAIHGGAGTVNRKHMTAEKEREYEAALRDVLLAGQRELAAGASALDVPDPPMLAPLTTTRLALPTVFDPGRAGWNVVFATLDDDGNRLEYTQTL